MRTRDSAHLFMRYLSASLQISLCSRGGGTPIFIRPSLTPEELNQWREERRQRRTMAATGSNTEPLGQNQHTVMEATTTSSSTPAK
uniref:Uncharacterized protein n=1 Tax=Caenorhabditis japonica TaxID=281687 RepID=A0A8R1I4X5_CAEJA